MNFTHYHCQNGFAKPVNPFDYDSTVEYTAYERFATFAKENTVSCSEYLSGEHKVEDFSEPVYQLENMGIWFNLHLVSEPHDGDGFSHQHYIDQGRNVRTYIQLKPVVKDCQHESLERIMGTNNVEHDICHQCGFLQQATQPEVKQQFGEWISVEIEPDPNKYYQLACNDDCYLDFFKWVLLDLSKYPTPCFMSVNDNTIMEKHEVTHYRELNVDPPDWTGLNTSPPKSI